MSFNKYFLLFAITPFLSNADEKGGWSLHRYEETSKGKPSTELKLQPAPYRKKKEASCSLDAKPVQQECPAAIPVKEEMPEPEQDAQIILKDDFTVDSTSDESKLCEKEEQAILSETECTPQQPALEVYDLSQDEDSSICTYYMRGEYLLIKPQLEYLAYARTSEGAPNPSQVKKRVESDFTSAFRLQFGMAHFEDSRMNLFATWTRIHHDFADRIPAEAGKTVLPLTTGETFLSPVANAASAKWGVKHNVLDLQTDRVYEPANHLTLMVSAGFRGAWNEQSFDSQFLDYQDNVLMAQSIVNVHEHVDVDAYGLVFGLRAYWNIHKEFSFYTNVKLSLLHSHFDVSHRESVVAGASVYTTDNMGMVTPTAEFVGGFAWNRWFKDETSYMGFHIGWEHQVWHDYNQFMYKAREMRSGNMSFSGLNIGAIFAF